MPANLSGPATCAWDASVDRFVSNDAGVGFVPEEDLVGRADIVLLSWDSSATLARPGSWFSNFRSSRAFHRLK
jgi:signal peptidase I